MSSPWLAHTPKDIRDITHGTQMRRRHEFIAPPPIESVTFSRADLSASIAMTGALSGAPPEVISDLAQVAGSLVAIHVSDGPATRLEFLDSVLSLADNFRTYFSSCVGAGFADQYARALGYRFRCNSREVVTRGRTGDYVYGGGPLSSSSVVMVEAKGSIVRRLSAATFRRTVTQGYREQVAQHVGRSYEVPTFGLITIDHGYAIGCGADLPEIPAIGHVVETGRSESGRRRGKASIRAPGDQPPDPPTPHGVSPTVVIGNFKAIADLLGATELRAALDRVRRGERLADPINLLRTTATFTWRGQQFAEMPERQRHLDDLVARDTPVYDPEGIGPLRFALWRPMLIRLLACLRSPVDPWRLPAVPAELLADSGDGGAVLPDGFALLPPRFHSEAIPEEMAPPVPPLAPASLSFTWDETDEERAQQARLRELVRAK